MGNGETSETQLVVRVEALEREYEELKQAIAALMNGSGSAPNGEAMTALLDSIPGAFERAEQGRQQAERGEGIDLEELRDWRASA
jgi:DNA-binding ferritin-like protein (Dps family)